MSKSKTYGSLDELGGLLNEDEKAEIQEKDEYQEEWRVNKYQFREMVAKKNRRWLEENAESSDFKYYEPFPEVYDKIANAFSEESKRKWLIHIITNFLPLNRVKQASKIPVNKHICPFSAFELTDTNSLMTGDRDKHLAFTGVKSNVLLSGVALQELERFVNDCVADFDSREGQIVNFALDQVRSKSNNKKHGKGNKKKGK